jgi:serine/threonine protein kinase
VKDVINGRYQIRRKLGSGGMATVYLAHDPVLGRDVAIKIPRVDSPDGAPSAEVLDRFQAELRAIGRLNHPNIVTIYDGGQEDGLPYLVMEPVEGETLAQLIRREAPLPLDRTLMLGRQVADALAYAHRQGIVHRDVKPQNVLIDRSGRAKVTDFGIAKSGDVTRTLTGTILGTANFMAPEVAAGEPATPAADIYGLGVVLYQMLTGHVPFESDNPIAAAVRSQREDAPPPSSLAPVPAWLDATVLRALARDPEDRYAGAAELGEALGGAPAQQPSPPPRSAIFVDQRDRTIRRASPIGFQQAAAEPMPKAETPEPAPSTRRRRPPLWLLPILAIGAVALGVALAALQAPKQPNSGASAAAAASPRSAPPSGSPNLLANGSLATNGPQPAGWRLQVFEGREPVRNWRPGGPSTADREITLESSSGTDSAWISGNVNVEPGWKLDLSGFLQARGIGGGDGAALWLVCQDAAGKQTGQAISQPVSGNTNWTQVRAQGAAPAGTATCAAQLRLGAPGKLSSGVAEFSRISLTAACDSCPASPSASASASAAPVAAAAGRSEAKPKAGKEGRD